MNFLFMSDFCKLAHMSQSKTEQTVDRLKRMGVEPMAWIAGERDGGPFNRPLYVLAQLKIIEAHNATRNLPSPGKTDGRIDEMQKQLDQLVEKFTTGDKA